MSVIQGTMTLAQLAAAVEYYGEWATLADALNSGIFIVENAEATGALVSIAGGAGQSVVSATQTALEIAQAGGLAATKTSVDTAAVTVLGTGTGYKLAGIFGMEMGAMAAIAAPLAGASIGAGLYESNPQLWSDLSKKLLPFCYPGTTKIPAWIDIAKDAVTGSIIYKVLTKLGVIEAMKEVFDDNHVGEPETTWYNKNGYIAGTRGLQSVSYSGSDSLGEYTAQKIVEQDAQGVVIAGIWHLISFEPVTITIKYIKKYTSGRHEEKTDRYPSHISSIEVDGQTYYYYSGHSASAQVPTEVYYGPDTASGTLRDAIKAIVSGTRTGTTGGPVPGVEPYAPALPIPGTDPDFPIIIIEPEVAPTPIPATPITPLPLPPHIDPLPLPEHVPDPTPEEAPDNWPEEEPWPPTIPFPWEDPDPSTEPGPNPEWPEVMPWPLPKEDPSEWPNAPENWPEEFPEEVPWPSHPESWPEEVPWPETPPDDWPEGVPWPDTPEEWPEEVPWPVPWPESWPTYPPTWPDEFPDEIPWPSDPTEWPEEVPWPDRAPDWWPQTEPWPDDPDDWPEEIPWPMPPAWPIPWPETIPYPIPYPHPEPTPDIETIPKPGEIDDPQTEVEPYIDPVPFPWPTPAPLPQPDPDPTIDPSQPEVKPETQPQPQPEPVDPTPTPPSGEIEPAPPPIIPLPFSSTTGLISVYHPTQSELLAFCNWLWVTWQDATIDKIWNNPFDGIITLFELYCTPTDVGRKNIRSGFLDSGVSSETISRYTEIDCGSIGVPEYFGNYLDYAPYSKCHIYLPFIGIIELNVDDIVGHGVNVTYRIDEYNGSCIAMITVAKSTSVNGTDVSYSNIMYQFSGNCAVDLPIAGGSQAAIKAGMLEAAAWGLGSVVGGIMGGSSPLSIGADMAYGAASAVHSLVSAKSSVQHSGSFGASFGALGNKKPFIIVTRPKQIQVPNYQELYGYPAHKMVVIGECNGYLRCREVHVISPTASDEEKTLIEQMLKEGVYVTE